LAFCASFAIVEQSMQRPNSPLHLAVVAGGHRLLAPASSPINFQSPSQPSIHNFCNTRVKSEPQNLPLHRCSRWSSSPSIGILTGELSVTVDTLLSQFFAIPEQNQNPKSRPFVVAAVSQWSLSPSVGVLAGEISVTVASLHPQIPWRTVVFWCCIRISYVFNHLQNPFICIQQFEFK